MTADRITGLEDLRPGDIMFGPIGGLVGLGVGLGQLALREGFRMGKLSIRHVGIVVKADGITLGTGIGLPHLVQAMPRGAEVIELREDTHWTDRFAYARLPEDYPGQAEDAAAIARLMVTEGVAYSFASYAALAARRWGVKTKRLDRWINRRRELEHWFPPSGHRDSGNVVQLPREAICSVLADQAWSLAGKRVVHGTTPQVVTPGMMAGQLARRPGVVWGSPGVQW